MMISIGDVLINGVGVAPKALLKLTRVGLGVF